MHSSLQCPLCSLKKCILIEKIDSKLVIKLYKRNLGLDCKRLFHSSYFNYFQCTHCELFFYSPCYTGDEEFYSSLQENEWYYLQDKNEYTYASRFIKYKDTVLDVGCGKGDFSDYVSNKQAKFLGLDFSSNAKNIAEKNGVSISNMSIQEFSENYSESVDIVTSFQVLEHVSNPKSFIESKLKALKVGGLMIIAVPSEDSFLSEVTNGVLNMPPHHLTRWTDKTLRFIAKEFNLSLESLHHENVQPIHYDFYWNTIIQSLLTRKKLIDVSYNRKVISKVVSVGVKLIGKYLPKPNTSGHTVIAVYRKL